MASDQETHFLTAIDTSKTAKRPTKLDLSTPKAQRSCAQWQNPLDDQRIKPNECAPFLGRGSTAQIMEDTQCHCPNCLSWRFLQQRYRNWRTFLENETLDSTNPRSTKCVCYDCLCRRFELYNRLLAKQEPAAQTQQK